MRLAQCPRYPREKFWALESRLQRWLPLELPLPRLFRLQWWLCSQTGLAVGINSYTFTLRSREVNSFPARAGRPVGGWPQGAEGRQRLSSAPA